ncbi:MAG: GFA family protein [Pseudomonadota bacterium]
MTGGCACGAVRYRLDEPPLFVHACHCRHCQRESGAPFVINAMVGRRWIEIAGEVPVAVAVPTASGSYHAIHRCPTCQTPLWSAYARRARMIYLRACTLDAPEVMRPSIHIYTASKVDWLDLPPGAPQFPAHYDRHKVWPADSLARLDALR